MEKSKKAVALQYDSQSQGAPKVIAKGKGTIAETIITKAKEYDIPLFQNKELVDSLFTLDIDKEIPAELYKAVADVFIWLMKTEQKLSNKQT